MLKTFVVVLHTLFAVGLTATVLLQSGRSAGLGMIQGGGEQVFGKKKGMDDLLQRFTTVLAILFLGTSIWLIFLYRR